MIGVHELEVGIPAMGKAEQRAITAISNLGWQADLLGWNRAVISDIQASIACGLQRVHISIPVSAIQITAKFQGQWQVVLCMQQNPHFLAIAYIGDDPKAKMDKVELSRSAYII